MELGRRIFVADSLPEVHLRHQAESTDHPETLHVFVINHIIFAATVTTTQRKRWPRTSVADCGRGRPAAIETVTDREL
jgi:hypothetical protein